jgi:hypothetical protein
VNIFFLSGFPAKMLKAFIIATMRATCPDHLIVFHWIILIISGED